MHKKLNSIMNNNFKTINPKELQENIFTMLDNEWMLITAGELNSFNTMTASWGGFGILWNKPVAFIFVRPQRYTHEFTEKYPVFTLTFFEGKYREILSLCGTKSGKEIDKMKGIGLTPAEASNGSIYFNEARIVMECRKIYRDNLLEENFIVPEPLKNYPTKDFHTMYIGEITKCMIRE